MNVFTRFFRYLKGLINGNLDKWENPEVIINEAVREMKENQIKNRELAVQAITQKNNLQQQVDSEERLVAEFERKATMALTGGNRELAKQFLKEKAIHEQTLESMRANLANAIEASEKVKIAIKNEEDRIRVRTSEALALKANMKQAQIQISINKALDQFQFSDTENQWTAAKDRITSMQSEASARGEIASTSIDAKMRELEYNQMDAQAEDELAKLEAKMATNSSPASRYTTTTTVQQMQTVGGNGASTGGSSNGTGAAVESDLDKQLRELEEKLGKR